MKLVVEIEFNFDGTHLYIEALGALRESIQRTVPRGESFTEFAPKVFHGGAVRDPNGFQVGRWGVVES